MCIRDRGIAAGTVTIGLIIIITFLARTVVLGLLHCRLVNVTVVQQPSLL